MATIIDFIARTQPSRLRIRRAVAEDIDAIYGLVQELAAYEKLSSDVEADIASLRVALFGPAPRVFCELIDFKGQLAGFAVWFYSFSTFKGLHGIWLEDLYIRPPFRGNGCGKALLVNLARRCARENLGRLEWSVLDWNEPAIGFYRHMGATLLDQWTSCRIDGGGLLNLAQSGVPEQN